MKSKDKTSSVEIHRLKKELEYLESKKGKGTELITIYIPPDKDLNDVMSHMRKEHSQAMNIKSARTRKNVQSALDVIMQRLKMLKSPPENGLVLLAGTIPYDTKDKMEVYMFEPPQPLQTYIYHCDSYFLLDQVKEMLEEKRAYGLLLVDRSEATVGLLRGKRLETLKKMSSNVPRKHTKGGQSQRRFERLIEIAAHEYFKKVGSQASESFLAIPELEGVFVGGPGPTKEFFVDEGYLHHEVEKKVIDIIDTSYTDEYGLKELVEKASSKFEEMEITREKELVQGFLKEVIKDHGLAAYGTKEVREMLEVGAVKVLLFSEDVESYKVKLRCSSCRYREERTVKDLNRFRSELSKLPCENCSEKNLNLDSYRSTLDELEELADSTGAKIEIISSETEEGEQLKGFGGVAALLRFRPW